MASSASVARQKSAVAAAVEYKLVAVEFVEASFVAASFAAVALSYFVPSSAGHAHAFASSALALALALAAESASVVGNKGFLATKVFVLVVQEPVLALVLAPGLVLLALASPSPVLVAL